MRDGGDIPAATRRRRLRGSYMRTATLGVAAAAASLVEGCSAATQTSGLWLSPPKLEPEFSAVAGWLTRPALRSDFGVVILPPAGYAYSSSHRFWRMLAE